MVIKLNGLGNELVKWTIKDMKNLEEDIRTRFGLCLNQQTPEMYEKFLLAVKEHKKVIIDLLQIEIDRIDNKNEICSFNIKEVN